MSSMLRKDFQELAELRLKEAIQLQERGLSDGAYYLGGYAIEFALKACVAKQTREFEFPDRRRAEAAWKHDLEQLVKAAGLEPDLDRMCDSSDRFEVYWGVVKDWNEQSRYRKWNSQQAKDLLDAIRDDNDGVMRWLKQHW